ncbi:Hypothetical predicted protein [Olea europaea subsp. europaea]|uniref:Uncharacterized protein n=1 Tax=Olea europaea subsp. europaea TaxID=158383 RepID=A0A8S0P9X0_OLEEU|nr:Hypothetical predicted protein [Olea europaea subsp. europaea]
MVVDFGGDMDVENLELDELEMFKAALEEELINLKTKAEPSSSSLITEEFKILNTKAENSSSCSLIRVALTSEIYMVESNHGSIFLTLYKLQFNNIKLRGFF